MLSDVYMDQIESMSKSVYNAKLSDKEEVRQYVRDITALIYDYKMVGMIYDIYAEDVEYYKQSRIAFTSSDEVVQQVLGFTAEFPDLRADIENIIVSKVDDNFYKIFRRLRYRGTSLGFSKYGPPTGKSLGDACLNLSLFHLKKTDDGWKITFEVNSDSEVWIREVQTPTDNMALSGNSIF